MEFIKSDIINTKFFNILSYTIERINTKIIFK